MIVCIERDCDRDQKYKLFDDLFNHSTTHEACNTVMHVDTYAEDEFIIRDNDVSFE